jgi:lysophospholipase L1-like esterase
MPNLVGVGDSITAGDQPGSAPYLNNLSLGPNWAYGNRGIDSDTLVLMSAAPQVTFLDSVLNSTVNNVLVVWAGTNDFAANGSTVSTVSALLQSYCQARQLAGWKVVVVQMLSRTGTNPIGGETLDTDKTAYNAFIDANWPSFASAKVTMPSVLTADGSYANGMYFTDGIHPTALAVTTLIAPAIQSTIAGLGYGGGVGLAVVNVSNGGSVAGVSTVSTLTPITSSNGNLLVAHAIWVAGPTITSVKNTVGTSFTATTRQDAGGGSGQFLYLPNITGNPLDFFTCLFSGSTTFVSLFVWEVMGADKVSPFDVTTALASGTGATGTTGSFSTALAHEIVLATIGGGTDSTFGAQATYTLDSAGYPSGAGNLFRGSEHKVFNTAQSGITTSMTQSPSGAWLIQAAAFKQSSVGQVSDSYAFES